MEFVSATAFGGPDEGVSAFLYRSALLLLEQRDTRCRAALGLECHTFGNSASAFALRPGYCKIGL